MPPRVATARTCRRTRSVSVAAARACEYARLCFTAAAG